MGVSFKEMARWPSGKAEVCKTSIRGFDSRPCLKSASARVVELVDTQDLKSDLAILILVTPITYKAKMSLERRCTAMR